MYLVNMLLEKCLIPVGDLILGSQYGSELRRMRRLVGLSENEINTYQAERIRTILEKASLKSEYYRSFRIHQCTDPVEWLKQFPVLEKSTLRKNVPAFLTTPEKKLIKNHTSGSTGLQTMVYVTKLEQSKYRAAQTVWWEWAGYFPGYPILQTGLGTVRSIEKRLKDFFFRTY